MRIKLLVATHGRHDSLRLMVEGLHDAVDTFDHFGIKLIPVFGGDAADKKWVEGYNFYELDNQPLGRKMNELLVCDTNDYDYIMQLGSDDVITSEGCALLSAWMYQEAPMFGFNSLYIANRESGEVRRVTTKMVFGAGRCIRRDVVKSAGRLWDDLQRRGLDGNSQTNIFVRTKVQPRVVTSYNPVIWDIKDADNLNKWELFDRYPLVSSYDVPECLKGIVKPSGV